MTLTHPAHAAAEAQVRVALASDPVTIILSRAQLEPIPGGLSNFSWSAVADDGRRCFVRLATRHVERLGADHRNEGRVLSLASAAGVAPAVVRCDPDARLLVTEWVESVATVTTRPRGAHVRAVAARLARLHGLQAPPGLRVVDFAAQATVLQAVRPASGAEARLIDVARDVFARLESARAPQVVCHHDLNPLNVLWASADQPCFVDWEYAGLGDAAIDLASFASQHGLGPDARRSLLRHYGAAGGAVDPDRFALAGWVFDYVQWLWYRATEATDDAVADRALVQTRARRLRASLAARASRVLRCNNAPFGA